MYNIRPCCPRNMLLTRSLVVKVFNEIVKALNVEEHLPKIIIIMFDMNLIEEVNFGGFGCKTIFEKLLQWLAKNLEITLEVQKSDLKSKGRGAIPRDDEPSLLWMKMLTRPFIKSDKGFIFAQCNTFNAYLASMMSKIKNSQVIDVTLPLDVDNFDHTGHISGVGMEAVWCELNRIVCRIDRDIDEEGKYYWHVKSAAKRNKRIALGSLPTRGTETKTSHKEGHHLTTCHWRNCTII